MARLSSYVAPEDVLSDLGFPTSISYPLTANSIATQKKVYVGATYVTHFPVGSTVMLTTGDQYTGTSNPRTKYLVEYGTVATATAGNTYIELTANLANTFNTTDFAEVVMLSKYTNATRPTWSDVDRKIQNIEDRIDAITHTTWKTSGRAYTEWHNFHPGVRRVGFSLSGRSGMWWDRDSEYAVYLGHSPVFTLSATADTAYSGYKGDSIRLWYGTETIEIFSPTNPYSADSFTLWTPGRNKDYWIDYELGILMFNNKVPNFAVRAIEIIYRAGNTIRLAENAAGMGDIQEAARLLAKVAILQDRRFLVDFPGGNDALQLQQAISSMKNDAEHILLRHTEHVMGYDRH